MVLPNEVIEALRAGRTAVQQAVDALETDGQQQLAAAALLRIDNVLDLYDTPADTPAGGAEPDEVEMVMYHINAANAILTRQFGCILREQAALERHIDELEQRAAVLDALVADREARIAAGDAIIERQGLLSAAA